MIEIYDANDHNVCHIYEDNDKQAAVDYVFLQIAMEIRENYTPAHPDPIGMGVTEVRRGTDGAVGLLCYMGEVGEDDTEIQEPRYVVFGITIGEWLTLAPFTAVGQRAH